MKITKLIAAAVIACGFAGAANAQTYMGGEVMLQDQAGFIQWGDPSAQAHWGYEGETLNDYSGWNENPDIQYFDELTVAPSYEDQFSGWDTDTSYDPWNTTVDSGWGVDTGYDSRSTDSGYDAWGSETTTDDYSGW